MGVALSGEQYGSLSSLKETMRNVEPITNIQFIFGEPPLSIYNIPVSENAFNEVWKLLHANVDRRVSIIGIRLHVHRELWALIIGLLGVSKIQGTFEWFKGKLEEKGLKAEKVVAVFPTADSPRFCFLFKDYDAHRFLVNELLFPRRYSLTLFTRILLYVYRFIINHFKAFFLYRGVYLLIESK